MRYLCLALLLFPAFTGCVTTNPVTGQQQLALVSEADEIALGRQQMEEWIQVNEGPFPDPKLQSYVHAVGSRIASASHRPGLPYQFVVLNNPELNAVTLPGGKTMIHRGLLAELKNEDQLAALVAHEVGHSAAMHITSQITQQTFSGLLLGGLQWGLAKGGVQGSDYYLQGAGFGTQLVLLRFSRDMERQADGLALEYLARAGYNPKALLDLMNILHSNDRSGLRMTLLQSHPLTDERIANVQQGLARIPADIVNRPYHLSDFQPAMALLQSKAEAFAWEKSARAAVERRDYATAEKDLRKAIAEFPGYAPFYAHLTFVQLKAGRYGEARKTAAEAQRFGPNLFLCQSMAGLAYYSARDYASALRAFQAADRILPNVLTVQFYTAECYFHMGDRRRAIALYGQIFEQNPNTAEGQVSRQRLRQMGINV